jgi:hypothetical protein
VEAELQVARDEYCYAFALEQSMLNMELQMREKVIFLSED